MRRADLLIAALFVLAGLATIFLLIPRYVTASVQPDDLPPAFMPYIATVIGTLAMAALFVTRLVKTDSEVSREAPVPIASLKFVVMAASVSVAAFAGIGTFGYLPGAAVLAAGSMLLVRASLRVVVVAAVLLPMSLWLVFDVGLGFPLP